MVYNAIKNLGNGTRPVSVDVYHINSLRPHGVYLLTPWPQMTMAVNLSHICNTREEEGIFHDAYMQHQASMS